MRYVLRLIAHPAQRVPIIRKDWTVPHLESLSLLRTHVLSALRSTDGYHDATYEFSTYVEELDGSRTPIDTAPRADEPRTPYRKELDKREPGINAPGIEAPASWWEPRVSIDR